MRKKVGEIATGIIFIAAGIGFLGNVFEIWNFNLFFDGWWTLFIIVPCLCNMIGYGINTGNLIGLGVGAILLLSAQDLVPDDVLWKAGAAVLFVLIGVSILFRSRRERKFASSFATETMNGKIPTAFAIFSGVEPNFINMEFCGIESYAIFGGVELNLQNAIITRDCKITCYSIFGGTDIALPHNVKVKLSSVPIFGGTGNKFISSSDPNAPTVFIESVAIFGGADVV